MKLIAVPIVVGTLQIHVAKGRKWSVVEHALLEAVCKQPRTATELAGAANLPIRMVVESMINLMRVGWVELRVQRSGETFFPTAGGKAHVGRDDLPTVRRFLKRKVRYAIEQLTGSVLKYRELEFVWARRVQDVPYDAIISPSEILPPIDQARIVNSLLFDDEEFRGLVPGSSRPGAAYAIATIANGELAGLPGAPRELSAEIERIASSLKAKKVVANVETVQPLRPSTEEVSLNFSVERDLITGGVEHKVAFLDIVNRAAAKIVVHSTFIGESPGQEVLNALISAARRGVKVDLLWGKSDLAGGANATRDAGELINRLAHEEQVSAFLRVHHFSTESHAKLMVADDGSGSFVSVVGSCNWLSTGFKSFEVSASIKDSYFASEVMSVLAQMATAATGWSGGLVADLAGMAVNIKRAAQLKSGRRASARVVLASDHSNYVLRARDEAREHMVIASHRFGGSARNFSISPTRAAALASGVEGRLYYGRLSDGLTGDEAASLRLAPGAPSMSIRQIHDPRMHAKFLLWDNNDALITSQNLLSADPSGDFSEIGVHVHCPLVARTLRERVRFSFERV